MAMAAAPEHNPSARRALSGLAGSSVPVSPVCGAPAPGTSSGVAVLVGDVLVLVGDVLVLVGDVLVLVGDVLVLVGDVLVLVGDVLVLVGDVLVLVGELVVLLLVVLDDVDVVVVVAMAQLFAVMTLSSNVTAPVRAKRRPLTVVPV